MDSRASSALRIGDEWSVTLDGCYVVRFCGANAQELATRQLHELAELLGFDDPARGTAPAADESITRRARPRIGDEGPT